MSFKRRSGSTFDRDYYLIAERDSIYDDSLVGHFKRRKIRFLMKIFMFLLAVIFVGICILTLIFTYKSPYIFDPIERVRANFIDTQFCAFIFSTILLVIVNTKRKISKKLLPLFICTFICLLSIVGVTINSYKNFKNEYNETTFSQMYSPSWMKDNNYMYGKVLFLDECNKLNEYFKVKVITIAVGQYIMVLISGALCVLEVLHRKDYNRLEHENEILFDNEENVKY